MAGRKYKCYGTCNEKFEKEHLFVYSNKNYCKNCYDKVVKNNEDRVALYCLIKNSYGVTFPTSMHLAQIKRLKDQGYTYEDMILGMTYCINVLKMKFNPKMGFGYIANNIEQAKMHYEDVKRKSDNIFETFDNKNFESKKVVVAKIDNSNALRESKIINLEDIL